MADREMTGTEELERRLREIGMLDSISVMELGNEAAAALAAQREQAIARGDGAIDAVLEACAEALGHDVVLGELAGEFTELRERIRVLSEALRFYANGDHWIAEGGVPMKWDTCSGEPQNWYWRENENDDAEGIEDGEIAKMALLGKNIDWEDEPPKYIKGETEYEVALASLPSAPAGETQEER